MASDLFRFMTLRAPESYDYEHDLITLIHDHRLSDHHVPAETHDINQDVGKFKGVAGFVFDQIVDLWPSATSGGKIRPLNKIIAERVRSQFGIDEKTGMRWIDEFVQTIRSETRDFDRARLLTALDSTVKKHFPGYAGIQDYVGRVDHAEETKRSPFCRDFEHLYERLYVLYVGKRAYPINLEYVMNGLQALHVVRFLALERLSPPEDREGCLTSVPVFRNLGAWLNRPPAASSREQVRAGATISSGTVTEKDEAHADCAVKMLTRDGALPLPHVRITSGGELASLFSASPSIHKLLAYLIGYYKPFNDLRPVGIGDLLVVRQKLWKYEAGELSHVENVLKGESKERSYRRFNRSEETYTLDSEKNEETEKELETTSRFELQAETASTIQNDLSLQLAASVSGTFGMVQVAASTGIAYSLSKSDSKRSASNFSKDIVERSLSRIQQRVREERSTKTVSEVEEVNKHGINNTNGSGNIAGLYRWLDKHYQAQVYNYGKRLMFEFVIPEPAAFIKAVVEARKKRLQVPAGLDKPIKPGSDGNLGTQRNGKLLIGDIDQADADYWAAYYGIPDMEPEPAESYPDDITCTMSNPDGSQDYHARDYSLDIKPGYYVSGAQAVGACTPGEVAAFLQCTIGSVTQRLDSTSAVPPSSPDDRAFDVLYEPDTDAKPPVFRLIQGNKLAVAVLAAKLRSYAFNVTVTLTITRQEKYAWQFKTYGKIMAAYEQALADYQGALADYEAKLESYNASKSVVAEGYNPKINEDIVKTELKKHCITMLTKQFASDQYRANDIDFDAMETRVTSRDDKGTATAWIPAIDIDDAREKGTMIQFLEQAFDWPQTSYLLYPYFWGRLPDWWFESQEYFGEVDPLYAKFLQAGSARVLVAVHPAYEKAVMHFLYTQEPWNGGEAPSIDDPLYIPIYAELRNQQDDLNGAVPYGDPWDVVVPTALVYLQANADLPVFDLGARSKQG